MIFKKINEYHTVRSDLFFQGDKVIYKNEDAIVEINESGIVRELFSSKENFALEKADATGLYSRERKRFFRLRDGKTDRQIQWEAAEKKQIKYIDGDLFLLRSEQPDGTWKLSLMNFDSGEIIWEVNDDHTHFCTRYLSFFILLSIEKILSCHDVTDGRKLWELDVKTLAASGKADLFSPISGWEDRIFFYISDLKEGATFCLDIQEGKMVERIEFGTWILPYGDYFYGASSGTVRKLDPVSFRVEDIDIANMGEPCDMEFSWNRFFVDGDELYFAAKKKLVLGCVSLKERKLVWSDQILARDELEGIDRIVVSDNRLYVLTNRGVLHFFQRR
jgi:hypothetical protein